MHDLSVCADLPGDDRQWRGRETSRGQQPLSRREFIIILYFNHSLPGLFFVCLQAESHPKVQELIQKHIPILQEFVLVILKRLKEVINEVPFGIRWLCKATQSLVHEKFPEAEIETINAFVGGFFFLRYVNPVIVTPHGE